MSPTKFKPLLAATVMSAIYMAGVPTTSQATVQTQLTDTSSANLQLADRKGGTDYVIPEANQEGLRRYIVQLDKEPASGPSASSRQNTEAYVNQLITDQNALESAISSTLNRTVNSIADYQRAYNGIVLMLNDREARIVQGLNNVKQVHLDKDYVLNTDAGPQLIGADNLWNGSNPDVGTATGEGMVVGIIDTGINSGHPSFADTDADGYVHTNPLGAGNYLGACDSSNTDQYVPSFTCNAKLIGAYDFVNSVTPGSGNDNVGPEDENGHGSHTAGTAAGNKVDNVPYAGQSLTISGVARQANIVMFDACYNDSQGRGLCPGVSTLASVEQAIEDGVVDVINFSIGGGTSPWNDPVSMAFLSATQAGIFVSASAGNSGPGAATLGHVEPWTASVAATTHGRQLINTTMNIGATPALQNVEYEPAVDGPAVTSVITADMRFAGDVDPGNDQGCNAWPGGNEFNGEIALIDIYDCPFAQKTGHAFDAGAVAVVIMSVDETPYLMGGFDGQSIPSMSIARSQAQAAIAEMAGGTVATEIQPIVLDYNGQADVVASFSSRGPSPFEYNKPDVAAPGVAILAAYTDSGGTDPDYATISGTSMAAPHNAGAAALLMQLNPTWSVAEVKSALMMKAVTAGVTKEDGVTQADPFDIGAGRIQVDNAATATLVLDETATTFAASDPANGGDLKTLNVASLTDYNCQGTCTFTRTFRSVADDAIEYQASLNGVPGTVTPSSFTVPKNGFQTLTIEVDASALPFGAASFGQLVIEDVPPSSIEFTQAVATEIPDGAYPGNSACGQVTVSGVTHPLVGPMSVDLDIGHNWIGDLVITLENPNGDVLGLMSRPGMDEVANPGDFGSSDDFVSGATVRFIDSAATSAEDSTGCASGVCELAPAPDSLPTPPATLAEAATPDVNGTWEVCVGDAGAFITGPFNSMTLNMPTDPAASTNVSAMPITVVAVEPSADINVLPGSLSYVVAPDGSAGETVYVQNGSEATAALDWSVQASGTAPVKQFEQTNTGTGNGIVSDYFDEGSNFGAYSADNFMLNGSAQLDVFYFDGFTNGTDLNTEIDAFTVEVYADNAGKPAGDPETASSALYTLTLPVGDPNLTLTAGGEVTVDVLGAVGSSWNVDAGNYWVSGYANFIGVERWNWYAGNQAAGDVDLAQIIDPSDAFGAGYTSWTDLTDVDPVFAGLAFSVTSNYTCGAPWLSTSSSSGTGVAAGSSDSLAVTVDATGLSVGVHTAALCINSNDTSQPTVVVPVTVEVSDLIFKDGFEGTSP